MAIRRLVLQRLQLGARSKLALLIVLGTVAARTRRTELVLKRVVLPQMK